MIDTAFILPMIARFLFEFFIFLYSIPDKDPVESSETRKRKSMSVGCLEDISPSKRYFYRHTLGSLEILLLSEPKIK